MENILKRAEQLSKASDYDSSTAFHHLIEEVGEVGTILNVRVTGRKKLEEPIFTEIADVINVALEVFFKEGGTIDLLKKVLREKQNKWESNLCMTENKK